MNWRDRGVTGPVAVVAATGVSLGLAGFAHDRPVLALTGVTLTVIALVFAVETRIGFKIRDLQRRLDELETRRR